MFNSNITMWYRSSISLAVTLNVTAWFAAYRLGEFALDKLVLTSGAPFIYKKKIIG